MKYEFSLTFSTDGDFGFSYVPMGMKYDSCDDIVLEKEFYDKEKAFNYIKETCGFLKNHINGRKYVVEYVNDMLDNFCKDLESDPNKSRYEGYISGNFEGTEITLTVRSDHRVNFTFGFTDEEHELLKKGAKYLTNSDLKDLIVNECKKKLEENKDDN